MNLRISSLLERLRSSLFFVPMVAVIVATVLGLAALAVDRRVDTPLANLPFGFTSTVESARTLLGVIAGATISFAGIAFSVSLLLIQLASSQYSPRVVHALFRDPFNKRVMAFVVGTFTYCVVVLRSVRSALEFGGDPVIPSVSVAIAVVLGIAAILAIVAFINHSAHAMDISEILERIQRGTIERIRAQWTPTKPGADTDPEVPSPPAEPITVIRAHRSGWIQKIDTAAILDCLPDGTTAHVETEAGRYAIEDTRLIVISPPIDATDLTSVLHAAFDIGKTRTMQQDVAYGLRQLVDVSVKALSPGVNDPTTAQEAIFNTAAVLSELLRHDPPPAVTIDRSRRLVMARQPSHPELVQLAYDEPRRAAATHPAVCLYLLATLDWLIETLNAAGLERRTTELKRQARLVADGCGSSTPLGDDLESVKDAYAHKFKRRDP
ncbi:MAG TPA: DUF2254 domain-containing protein [Acidimicrobiia bacterium]|nr:DUF2254 domain-containing protein [Acidimicrobiia bacterium]